MECESGKCVFFDLLPINGKKFNFFVFVDVANENTPFIRVLNEKEFFNGWLSMNQSLRDNGGKWIHKHWRKEPTLNVCDQVQVPPLCVPDEIPDEERKEESAPRMAQKMGVYGHWPTTFRHSFTC